MKQYNQKQLSREKNILLEEWKYSSGEDRLKLLVRLMDIDDELSEGSTVDGAVQSKLKGSLHPMFRKKRRLKNMWLD